MTTVKQFAAKWIAVFTLFAGIGFGYVAAQNSSALVSRISDTSTSTENGSQMIGCPMGQTGTCP